LADYGLPYQGSKQAIIHKIATLFPECDNFYDLFGGGFSVSHFMLAHRKCRVHYNEIEPSTVAVVKDAIAGRYSYDRFLPEWVTREMFDARKATCAYTRIVWSFGNNQKYYLFGKDVEARKRSLHMAVVFGEFDKTASELLGITSWPEHLSIRGRRMAACGYLRKTVRLDLERLQRLQRLEQLEQFERLERLQRPAPRLSTTSLSYESVPILPNSVIYCDPPYVGTAGYTRSFDHDKFWQWVRTSPHRIFVSEYTAPPDMKVVMAIRHQKTNSQTSTASVEKVFTHERHGANHEAQCPL